MAQIRAQFVTKMVRKVLADSQIKDPPVDLVRILKVQGIQYEEVEDFPDSVDALIIEDGEKVYAAVNARQHLHRRRFSLAHELGHYFLHRDGPPQDLVDIDNPPADQIGSESKGPAEIEADLFAGELLVPLDMLRKHVSEGIPAISKTFVVSEQVVAIAISRHMRQLFK